MGTEMQLDAGIVKFRIDLQELAGVMRALIDAAIGANEKARAREAMKTLLEEATKTFATIVETLKPLYAIRSESDFAATFATQFADFKALYQNRNALARTHCGIVEGEFSKLNQRRAWMSHLPVAQNAYGALEAVCQRWLFQDWKIVDDMEAFIGNLNAFLTETEALNRTDVTQSYQKFRTGLTLIEKDFLAMKAALGELAVQGGRL